MKKFIGCLAVLCAVVVIGLVCVGCGTDSTNQNATNEPKKEASSIKIEDIDWAVDEGVDNSKRYVMLSYTNNSKLTISEIEMTFSEKSDITEEQKTKYLEDMKKELKLDDSKENDKNTFEQLKEEPISMRVDSEKVCHQGESVTNEKFCYYSGIHYVMNIEHFNLCEPDIATIKYIDNDKIFTVNYDFKSKKYTKDSKEEIAFNWTEKEIGNKIPKPKAEIVTCSSDNEDYFSFDIYGWTLDDFNSYVKECKEMGYTVDIAEHEGFYSADNENGYNIYLSFDNDDGRVGVSVKTSTSD